MPIFDYSCDDCGQVFETIVIFSQEGMGEPAECVACSGTNITKLLTSPAQIRMDGKAGLRSVPDPTPPLQKLKEQGAKEGCEGGYKDLEEYKPTKRSKDKDGNTIWEEPKKLHIDLGKNTKTIKENSKIV